MNNSNKIKQYQKNNLLRNIISELFPKKIFQKILNRFIRENIVNNFKTTEKTINIIN